jgi:hypothetical protein
MFKTKIGKTNEIINENGKIGHPIYGFGLIQFQNENNNNNFNCNISSYDYIESPSKIQNKNDFMKWFIKQTESSK